MDFLRDKFEASIQPVVEGRSVFIGSIEYTATQILNRFGDDIYKQAFGEWIWEEWLPPRLDRRDVIIARHANGQRYRDLCQIDGSGAACPFIGSGMSEPSGMPLWGRFLRSVRAEAQGFTADELETCLRAGLYEDAASRISTGMPPQLFRECFERHFPQLDPEDIDGAIQLLPFLFQSAVVTTNFDTILESVYGSNGMPFQSVLHGTEVGNFRRHGQRGARCLLKIHGHYDAVGGRVLLKEEYERFYHADSPGRQELAHLFQRGGLVFLGCSLYQDRTMALLKDLADRDPHIPRSYALLQQPAPEVLTEREHFLAERNIFPIWYDGDHNTDIEALLVGLMDDLKRL